LPRHQTLRGLIDWSYDALTSEEQDVLRRLSVFAGGWDLHACQTVCSLGGLAVFDVLSVLGSLVSKSLVQAEATTEGLRYGLLETIRQYGAETGGGRLGGTVIDPQRSCGPSFRLRRVGGNAASMS